MFNFPINWVNEEKCGCKCIFCYVGPLNNIQLVLIIVIIFLYNAQIEFHGIAINKEELILDGSEAPIRIDAEALLASEKLAPAAILNKVKYILCGL